MSKHSLTGDIMTGLSCKCPNCGEGRIFTKWLKVADACDACGEEFHHHRADDFPAYVVIFIMGHVMVSFALWLEDAFSPPMWMHLATTAPLTVILSLAILQPAKGAIVALQWHMGMHGFKEAKEKREAAAAQSTNNV